MSAKNFKNYYGIFVTKNPNLFFFWGGGEGPGGGSGWGGRRGGGGGGARGGDRVSECFLQRI